MSSKKAQKIMTEAMFKAHPIMRDECKRLGIPYPKIEWVGDITCEDESIGGTYKYETQKILLNSKLADILIKEGLQKPIVLRGLITLYFHEFKHYIDHKAHKVTLQEFRSGLEHYESQANVYAEELYKRVK